MNYIIKGSPENSEFVALYLSEHFLSYLIASGFSRYLRFGAEAIAHNWGYPAEIEGVYARYRTDILASETSSLAKFLSSLVKIYLSQTTAEYIAQG
jgi:hypothetical protein